MEDEEKCEDTLRFNNFLLNRTKWKEDENDEDNWKKPIKLTNPDPDPELLYRWKKHPNESLYRYTTEYNCSFMEQLLVAGANPNIMQPDGDTPLKTAIRSLLIGIKNEHDIQPYSETIFKYFLSLQRQVVLLLSYGADDSILFFEDDITDGTHVVNNFRIKMWLAPHYDDEYAEHLYSLTCREILESKTSHLYLYEQAEVERTMRKISVIENIESVLKCVVNVVNKDKIF
jgi:hypothetical protein